MKIPFTDLKREYKKYSKEYNNALKDVFNKSSFVLGEEVTKFENEFSKFIGSN
jgi:dTDP-4-amino-4,6-dideoxygalactose transaminase